MRMIEEARTVMVGMKKGPRCRVGKALEDHPERDEVAELLQAVPGEIPYNAAETVLRNRGIEVQAQSISRHVRGKCLCL